MKKIFLVVAALLSLRASAAASPMIAVPVYTEQQYRGVLTLLENFRAKVLALEKEEKKIEDRLEALKNASKNVERLPQYFGGRKTYIETAARPPLRHIANDLRKSLECVRGVQPRAGGYIIPVGCYDAATFNQAEKLKRASKYWNDVFAALTLRVVSMASSSAAQPMRVPGSNRRPDKPALSERDSLLAVLPDSYTVSIPDGQVVRCSASRPPCRQHLAVILQSLVDDWQKIKIEFSSPVATPGEPRVSSRGPTIQ